MHRLVWTLADESGAIDAGNGLVPLPRGVAAALDASAAVLLGKHAVLVGGAHPRPLERDLSLRVAGASLTWRASAAIGSLAHERTRRERPPSPAGGAPSRLCRADGEAVALGEAPLVVGRHPTCDLVLDDPRVSAFHCALAREDGAVLLVDLASANGTFVDELAVSVATLRHAASLRLGRVRLRLETDVPADALAPLPSAAMRAVEERLRRVGPTRIPVLIEGESGVGKDGVARRLHALSGRSGPLVALNAANLPPALAASELFGHVRGAFTGADTDHCGAFLRADGGTLFLDEVAELPPPVQAELLRAVEAGRIRRLGELVELPVDVRIVAATHRDLAARVRAGAFREDLFHRLCVVPIAVPPLRERLDDLDAIADHFLASLRPPRRLASNARRRLHAQRWPGNVRELLNTLRRACAFTSGQRVEAEDLTFGPAFFRPDLAVEATVRERVVSTYARSGSVAQTARSLGLRRSLVHRVLDAERRTGRDEPPAELWLDGKPGLP